MARILKQQKFVIFDVNQHAVDYHIFLKHFYGISSVFMITVPCSRNECWPGRSDAAQVCVVGFLEILPLDGRHFALKKSPL